MSIKPRSILQLTITGFLLVAGLLIVALVVTADQLDGLSDRSQRTINQSVTAMRASRVLIEQTTSMERNVRQYAITGDKQMLDVYADRRKTFTAASQQLAGLYLDEVIARQVKDLMQREARAHRSVTEDGPNAKSAEEQFPAMLGTAYEISRGVDTWTNRELASIRREAMDTRELLTLQALVLVGAALVLAGVFTALITRPLLQVNRAINQLGSGSLATPVTIHGPTDLVRLGASLDWLRERLRKLEQQRTLFLRHVSHELKTPLAAIAESSSLLRDGAVGSVSDEQLEILRIQANNCQRLQRLIEDLLRYNADSFSVLNTMPQPVRLDRVIDNVVAAHELALKSQQLRVAREVERVTVPGDAEQLRVIVDNLMTNAVRFSPPGGTITLKLRGEGDRAVFEIVDEGPGILPEEKTRIFEAFFQGSQGPQGAHAQSATGTEHYKGTGLGLAIAEEYAKANGGTIEALVSNGGGHFRLSLPQESKRGNA
ncbi:MAG: ATP-binding protein [Pseudomonadota bacterium]|nr:ATP-binding protein [Pseudomonadota bacterium]